MPDSEHASQEYYDDFSKRYDAPRAVGYHRLIDELELSVIQPLARGKRVLEAGCGTGLILRELASVTEQAYGFDLSPGMVGEARQRGLSVVQGSVTNVPFADDSFDVVCSFKVLAHVPEIQQAVADLARVTVPGGTLVLEFYNRWSVRYLAKRIAGPQPISHDRTEADVFTRWDTPATVRTYLPNNVKLIDFRGVRVFTPMAAAVSVPFVGQWLSRAERAATTSPIRRLGGFLIAVMRKDLA